jgi:hypothetical protein
MTLYEIPVWLEPKEQNAQGQASKEAILMVARLQITNLDDIEFSTTPDHVIREFQEKISERFQSQRKHSRQGEFIKGYMMSLLLNQEDGWQSEMDISRVIERLDPDELLVSPAMSVAVATVFDSVQDNIEANGMTLWGSKGFGRFVYTLTDPFGALTESVRKSRPDSHFEIKPVFRIHYGDRSLEQINHERPYMDDRSSVDPNAGYGQAPRKLWYSNSLLDLRPNSLWRNRADLHPL